MPSTDDRPPPVAPATLSRRRVLVGLVGLPLSLAVAGCTGPAPQSQPSGSAAATTAATPTATTAPPPPPDLPALTEAGQTALVLLATYEATSSLHPALAPVLAPYAADHAAHLDALAAWIELPTPSPTTSPTTASTTGTITTPPVVPADPAAARAALVQAEQIAGDAATVSARSARDGEAARLLASIGASRAVHALLLRAPA